MKTKSIRLFLVEVLAISLVGVLVGLFANYASPIGINLNRNYFPKLSPVVEEGGIENAGNPLSDPPETSEKKEVDPNVARLLANGIQVISHQEVLGLFENSGYSLGEIILVDARNDQSYQAGHIPGAYQLDHYRIENYIEFVITACEFANQIIVYCNGGECEDSELVAIDLMEMGIDRNQVFVFPGGMTKWVAEGNPVETGPRESGILLE